MALQFKKNTIRPLTSPSFGDHASGKHLLIEGSIEMPRWGVQEGLKSFVQKSHGTHKNKGRSIEKRTM